MLTRRRTSLFHLRTTAVFLVALSLLSGIAAYSARAGQPEPVSRLQPLQRDVKYCSGDGVDLKMDLYREADPYGYDPQGSYGPPAPAVMFVHGGAWSSGDKAGGEGEPEITELVSRGYVVASVNYRLAPQFVFPAQINDVKCAVRYLKANAAALNIDPGKIGAWGASAGGHLVSLLGTADAGAGLEGSGGYSGESSRVRAVVDMYGRADLAAVPQTRPDLLPVFGSEADLVRYSPVTYVSGDDPPFLILHGEKDTTVPPQLSREFYDKLKAAGVPASLVTVRNAGHGFAPTDGTITPSRTEITHMVADFFDRYLRGVNSPASAAPQRAAVVEQAAVPKAAPLPPGGPEKLFPETGKTVRGKFLDYWNSHGRLAQIGYAISGELEEKSTQNREAYSAQYFERAVLEYHPENRPPFDVLAALLGVEMYRQKYPSSGGAPGQRPNTSKGSALFAQTGRRVGGVFLSYWQQHGGVVQLGLPISDEFPEKSALNGKTYTVQYFERAVLEYHPEFRGTQNEVLLSQLGSLKYRALYRTGGTGK